MINAVGVPAQEVLTQGTILFSTDRVRSRRGDACAGGWLVHDAGSGQFTLVNSGCSCELFEIQFNTNLTSATVGSLVLVYKRTEKLSVEPKWTTHQQQLTYTKAYLLLAYWLKMQTSSSKKFNNTNKKN